jgi:hypothetical protein
MDDRDVAGGRHVTRAESILLKSVVFSFQDMLLMKFYGCKIR